MRYLDDSHNWWSSPFDGDDAWEDGCVDKGAFYADLSTWEQEMVDALETADEKDALMHKFWLKSERDKWEEANS